jgi:tetratricopeptide (TPR) repeat protein
MVSKQAAYTRLRDYYQEFVKTRSTDFTALDYEFLQLEQVLLWLVDQTHYQHSLSLLNLVKTLSPYLERRSLNNMTLNYIGACLKAAQQTGQNPAWIYIIAYRANWALGRWSDANIQILQAVHASSGAESKDYATALQFLGSLQLNRGNYRDSLNTFAKAKKICQKLGDVDGEISIKAEEAAYYLNKADYRMAHRLYSEVEKYELAANNQVSDHTLLMMGVVSRRLRNFGMVQKPGKSV